MFAVFYNDVLLPLTVQGCHQSGCLMFIMYVNQCNTLPSLIRYKQ